MKKEIKERREDVKEIETKNKEVRKNNQEKTQSDIHFHLKRNHTKWAFY